MVRPPCRVSTRRRQAVLLGDQAGKAGWAKYRTQEAGEVFLIDRIEGETIYGRLV